MTNLARHPLMPAAVCLALAALLAVPTTGHAANLPDAAEKAFAKLKTYDYTQPRRPLNELELFIPRASGDPKLKRLVADRLAAVLADPKATHAGKLFACAQMPVVGTDAHVPVLAAMLGDAKTVGMARRALAGIRGEASGKVLLAALGKLKGGALVGLIHSLGDRRDAKATSALAGLLTAGQPKVAAAAARALGEIGTVEAGKALSGQSAKPWAADAMLRCAERLTAEKNTEAAEGIYRNLSQPPRPMRVRLAGMWGLARVGGEKALPSVLGALTGKDAVLQAHAVRMIKQIRGPGVAAALAAKLPALEPKWQALVIDVIAERGDRSAAGAVARLIDAKDEAVRAAAVRAMGKLGDASSVTRLLALAAAGKAPVQAAARGALARMTGPGVDKALLSAAGKGKPAVRAEAMAALAARHAAGADAVLVAAAGEADPRVRAAALEALAEVGGAESYAKLVGLLVSAAEKAGAPAAEKAVLAVGGRLGDQARRARPVVAALPKAPAKARGSLLRVLGICGGADALKAVRAHLASADRSVADAAIRALVAWADQAAAPDLLKLAKDAKSPVHRSLALRGYLRLARLAKDNQARLAMLQRVRQIATTTAAKRMLLSGLGASADPGAMEVASTFLDDPAVHAEAAMAMLTLGKALLSTDRAAVRGAMAKLAKAAKDKDVAEQAEQLLAQALKPPKGGVVLTAAQRRALTPDRKRSDAQKKVLAKRAAKGYHLACYLDCGPDTTDGAKGGPILRFVPGRRWYWPGAPVRLGTAAFDAKAVTFEATGLKPKKSYQLGLTWWDYDGNGRAQSVWAHVIGASSARQLMPKTALPAGRRKPGEKTIPLPRGLTAGGKMRIVVRADGLSNAVVSELWLWEADADSAAPTPATSPKPAAGAKTPAKPAPRTQVPTPKDLKATNVLIVTGIDYPGHKWKLTTPVLVKAIAMDKRLRVYVVEDPGALASEKLHLYKVVVHHWMNWKKPDPGPAARENLKKFVAGGKGMVMVHFACGAFQGWPQFGKLAGRAWNPKLRGHDPHRTFTVNIVDAKHPITAGLKPFKTTDELYTCLDGKTPIKVIANAKSIVDGKLYPMAFVLNYGKGRVFHSPLGHDVRAFASEGVQELFRRGTAWAAGLKPTVVKTIR